jgi:hypothetical protein
MILFCHKSPKICHKQASMMFCENIIYYASQINTRDEDFTKTS